VLLLPAQEIAGEGLEAQIGGVRMCDGQQILGIEVVRVGEVRRHEAGQEVALESGVVGHQCPARQSRCDGLGQLFQRRRPGHVRRSQTRQPLHRERQRAARTHQATQRDESLRAGLEQHDPELEDLRARVLRQPRRLEVHDGQGAGALQKLLEYVELHPDRVGAELVTSERSEDARRRSRPCTPCPGES
jgi:hypothetical protein